MQEHPAAHIDDDQHAKKRKRPTLSCLPCKKRKQKCDKLQPCGTCMTRGEPEFCEYDEGSTPPPQHAYVAQSDFLILQARVARLEHELKLSVSSASGVHTGTTTKSPLSLLSHKETPRTHHSNTTTSTPAADVEPTIHAIERMGLNLFDLAKYTAGHPSTDAEDGDTGDSKGGENAVPVWPSIIDQGNAKRIIKTKWVRDMTEVMQAIPKKEVVDTLIAVIVRDLHMPAAMSGQTTPYRILNDEVSQFHVLRDVGQHLAIDAAWLAHLCSTLWFAAGYCVRHPHITPASLKDVDLEALTLALYEAFETALYCAEYLFRPQLRILNAILIALPLGVRGPGLALTPYANKGTRMILYDVAVGIVKGLSLHTLGGPEDYRPLPTDLSLPKGKPRLAWQLASRLFGAFVFVDSFAMAWLPGHVPAFDTDAIKTDDPMNINIDDLLEKPETPVSPMTVLTDATWEIQMSHMSKSWRRILRYLALPEDERSWEGCLEVDAYARSHMDYMNGMVHKDQWDDTNRMSWHALRSGWMQRFLRLHRPFLIKSIESEDREYRLSYETCVDFSKAIIRNHKYVLERYAMTAVARDFVPIYSHHLSAVIILFIIGLLKPSMREEMLQEIRGSVEVYTDVARPEHPMYARVGPKGKHVVLAMVQILEAPPSKTQSFDQLLAEVERRAAAGPDPSLPTAATIPQIAMHPIGHPPSANTSGSGQLINSRNASVYPSGSGSSTAGVGQMGPPSFHTQLYGTGNGNSYSAMRSTSGSVITPSEATWTATGASGQYPLTQAQVQSSLPLTEIYPAQVKGLQSATSESLVAYGADQGTGGFALGPGYGMGMGVGMGMEAGMGMGMGGGMGLDGLPENSFTWEQEGLVGMDFDWDSLFKSF